ncbi:unnamed protein product [Camellia sinensis]
MVLLMKPKLERLTKPFTALYSLSSHSTSKQIIPHPRITQAVSFVFFLLFSPLFSLSPSFCLQNPLEESMSAGIIAAPVGGSSYVGLKPNSSKLFPVKDSVAWTRKTVSNGSKTHCMKYREMQSYMTWNPIDNKKFETLSYLPPLSDESIAKEIEYMLKKGWVPCLEFDKKLGMCIERTAECQDTMMGGTGHCGSCQCLVAVILHKSSMKSMIARRLTQMRIFVAWPSTASTNVNVCPLSFKNPPPPPKAVAASR